MGELTAGVSRTTSSDDWLWTSCGLCWLLRGLEERLCDTGGDGFERLDPGPRPRQGPGDWRLLPHAEQDHRAGECDAGDDVLSRTVQGDTEADGVYVHEGR